MKQLMLAGLLVCFSFQIGCTRGRESTTQAARETGRMSNSDLQKKIETQLNSDPQLRDANLSLNADTDSNRVTLSGTVASESLTTRAVDLTRQAQLGVILADKINVNPVAPSHTKPCK